jgi:hypothetical protein
MIQSLVATTVIPLPSSCTRCVVSPLALLEMAPMTAVQSNNIPRQVLAPHLSCRDKRSGNPGEG